MLNINFCGGFWMQPNLIHTQIRLKSRHQQGRIQGGGLGGV